MSERASTQMRMEIAVQPAAPRGKIAASLPRTGGASYALRGPAARPAA
jgi:hypothetical protein